MKYSFLGKYGKVLAALGGGLLVLGIIVFTAALGLAGWDIAGLSTTPSYEKRTVTLESGRAGISVQDSNVPVTVELSPDDKIHLTYFENEKNQYVIEDGESTVIRKESKFDLGSGFMFSLDFRERYFILQLPKNYQGEVEIKTSNASIELKEITAQGLAAQSSNGSIRLSDVQAAAGVRLDTNNSTVSVERLTAGEFFRVNNSNGRIEAADVTAGGEAYLDTSNSTVSAKRLTAGEQFKVKNSNGRIEAFQVSAGTEASLDTSNNSVELENLSAGEAIRLKNSNGRISGTVQGEMGDYSIRSSTSNGSSNLPTENGSGAKKLEAYNSNGDIKIEFQK